MLIMENSEEVLQILERFTKLKQKDIPKELEDYLCYVAKTGDTVYRWANIKYLFREKLVHVIKDFHDSTPSIDDLPQYPNVDPFNYETMKSALLERLELFSAAPFTVQRLCELLTDPRKQYSRIDKYMRALEKNILVVSTVEPGRKQPESENGDSLDSVVNGDISLDVNVDIDMENESIFRMETQNTPAPSASSSNKSDEGNVSAPKKAKIDTEESSIDKSKSGSDSDESSDDSDSQTPRETQTDDKEILSKIETENIDCKTKEDQTDQVGSVKQEQIAEISSAEKTVECSGQDSNEADKNEESTTEKVTPEEVEKREDVDTPEKLDNNERSIQPKEQENTLNSEAQKDETPCAGGNSDAQSEPDTSETSLDNTRQNRNETDIVHSEKLVELTTEIPPNTVLSEEKPTPTDENFIQQSQPIQSSDQQKIPEQMSIEEPQVAPVDTTSEAAHTNMPVGEQATSDQPMDEHLESEISSSCAADSSCMDEVVMQSESDMATEPIKMSDDKTDPTGMDVDDTSQEEAMDQ